MDHSDEGRKPGIAKLPEGNTMRPGDASFSIGQRVNRPEGFGLKQIRAV
jgi:hypothetical protein